MTLYSAVLFLHVVGTLGFFVMLGLEWISLLYLQRVSTVEPAREWLRTLGSLCRFGPISMATIFLSGFYMMYTTWGGAAWISVAIAAIILLAAPLKVLSGRRMAAIGRVVAVERKALSPAFQQGLRDPFLWTSIQIRVAIVLGIVFLMMVKPGLEGALLTIGVAIILGLASAWPLWRRGEYREYRSEI